MTERVLYDVADGVATVSLNHPATRNALSDALLSDLIAALERARGDEAVRCVVLASTHATTFSSGGDPRRFAAGVPRIHKHAPTEPVPPDFPLLASLGKPP